MYNSRGQQVLVTYFANPHDFCIIEETHLIDKNRFEESLQVAACAYEKIRPRVGMLVAVNDKRWKRAIVDEIGSSCCKCWLVDHGGYQYFNKMYSLPDEYKTQVPFVKQASLCDIVGIKKEFGPFKIQIKSMEKFTPGAVQWADDCIKGAKEVFFKCYREEGGIHIGELCVTDSNNFKLINVSEVMVTEELARFDRNLFENALQRIISNKSRVLIWGTTPCQSTPSKIARNKQYQALPKNKEGKMPLHSSPSVNKDVAQCAEQNVKLEEPEETDNIGVVNSTLIFTPLTAVKKQALQEYGKFLTSVNNKYSETIINSKCNETIQNDKVSLKSERDNNVSLRDKSCDTTRKTDIDKRKVTSAIRKEKTNVIEKKVTDKNHLEVEADQKTVIPNVGDKDMNASLSLKLNSQMLYKSGDYNVAKTKVQLEMLPSLLVEGFLIPPPIQDISNSPFKSLTSNYTRRFKQIYPIQSYMWPIALRRLNVFAISPPGSGKTASYLLPVSSFLLENEDKDCSSDKDSRSPTVLIICAESSTAESIFDTLQDIFENVTKKPCFCLLTHPPLSNSLQGSSAQWDVLITTPAIFTSLLKSKTVSLQRMCHIILEEGASLLRKFSKDVHALFEMMANSETINDDLVQIILVSDLWTTEIETFRSSLNVPVVVCVECPLEGAVYTKTKFEVHLPNEAEEKDVLADIFRDKGAAFRSIVICNSKSSIEEIEGVLSSMGLNVLHLGKYDKDFQMKIESDWSLQTVEQNSVLVCTDDDLNCLTFRNAVTLIHYDLAQSWKEFSNRFQCLLPQNPVQKKRGKCTVHILIDKSGSKQLSRIVQFLKRTDSFIPTSLQKLYEGAINRIEEEKSHRGITLCNELQLFGKCSNNKCDNRHKVFSNTTDVDMLPDNGLIKYKILAVKNVNRFVVKIVEYTDENGEVRKRTFDKNADVLIDKHLQEEKKIFKDAQVGDLCAASDGNVYKSCVVCSNVENPKTRFRRLNVKLLDEEREFSIKSLFLLQLPEDVHFVSTVVDVILCNAVPPGKDKQWSLDSKCLMKNILERALNNNVDVYFTSKISLKVENVLWVEDIHSVDNNTDIRKLLVEHQLIDCHREQLQLLKKMNNDSSDDDSEEIIKMKKHLRRKQKGTNVNAKAECWATLDSTYSKVIFSAGNTPSHFYVRLAKERNILEEFEKSLQSTELEVPTEIRVGKFYLAKDIQSGDYGRAMVLDLKGETASCFFLDYGDLATLNQSYLRTIKDEHINALPFQAIACSLYGVKPVLDCWSSEAVDVMYEFAMEPESDTFRNLYAKCIKKGDVALNNQTKHVIVLADYYRKESTFVYKSIVDAGLGVEDDAEDFSVFSIDEVLLIADDSEYYSEDEDSAVHLAMDGFKTEDDLLEFMKTFLNVNVDEPKKNENRATESSTRECNENTASKNYLTEIKTVPSSNYFTPNIVWKQTKENLKIRINLPDVDDYNINLIRGLLLSFSCTCQGKEYRFKYQLFAMVDKKYKCYKTGLYIEITLTKNNPLEWPRLIKSMERQIHITYEITEVEDQEKRKILAEVPDDGMKDDDFYYFVSGSETESDESDY